jgi:MFS family permease
MTTISPPTEAHLSPEHNKETMDSPPSRPVSQVSTDSFHNSFNPDWRFVVAFSCLSVITLMAALDATSISVALPIMARALNGTAIEAFWAGTSFLLTSTVFQPVLGNFSNIFGRKPLIFFSLTLFGVGAIVAALAKDFATILVGRSIQGIGGGGVIVMTEIVGTDMVPLRERGKWFGFISSMWALGTVAGPLLGGGFAQNVSWTWIFWINLPFIGIGTVMIVLFLKLNYKTSSFVAKLKRVDWIGSIVFVGATTGFLIPVS